MRHAILWIGMVLIAGSVVAGPEIRDTAVGKREGSDFVICRGTISLPMPGRWVVESRDRLPAVNEIYLVFADRGDVLAEGRRMRQAERQRLIESGQNTLRPIFWSCQEYARARTNIGPATLSDMGPRSRHLIEMADRGPWRNVDLEGEVDLSGPYVFLLPHVRFEFDSSGHRPKPGNRQVLAVELRPFVPDGKHFVLYTDGSCERVPVDANLMAKYDLTLRPILTGAAGAPEEPKERPFRILAVFRQKPSSPVTLSLRNEVSGSVLRVSWDVSQAAENQEVVEEVQKVRQFAWAPYAESADATVLRSWMGRGDEDRDDERRGRGETVSAFDVLGGRAAVRETLQMQVLRGAGGAGREQTVPIEQVKGVEVKSHPYEQMLAGQPGGDLPLAALAPADRFFVYVAKPGAILPFLDDGADFLSRFGTAVTGNSVEYDLKGQYLARLGMDDKWGRMFLASGAVKDLALIAPDLFFVDGTDVTLAIRLTGPAVTAIVTPLLKIVGVTGLTADNTVQRDLPNGRRAVWAMRGNVLFVSTSPKEMSAVLALQANGGVGSLGKSAEFRYMLTQLAPGAETRLFAYLSDPFIRRLVGPATKIGQLRRIQTRAALEHLTACALRAKLDGIRAASLEGLVRDQYGPAGGYTIGNDGVARSATWGTLAMMKTLSELPVEKATAQEAEAYRNYEENYARFWRQFFDPIAVRVDDRPDGSLEATTFILPLIDSTIYEGLRRVVAAKENGPPLKMPKLDPAPVMQVTLNVRDEAWREIAKDLPEEMFAQYLRLNPAILDDLGPTVSLAVHDSDPVVAMGSGDLLGAFGGGGSPAFGRNAEMVFIPAVLSVLTRPCTLLVETRNPEKTKTYLRQAGVGAHPRRRRFFSTDVDFYQVGDRDSWVCVLSLENIIRIRFGVEVQGSFLLIRNIPWSHRENVTVAEAALNGAALEANLSACRAQLPALFEAAATGEREATMRAAGCLYPLLLSGAATVSDAADKHAALLGYRPVHPGAGTWTWADGELSSSRYGSVRRQRQPEFGGQEADFGVLRGMRDMRLNAQLEQDGLRASVRWNLEERKAKR